MKPFFRVLSVGFSVLTWVLGAPVWAETIELVTYYPAPGGGDVAPPRLHTGRATIGDPYSLTNPADADLPNGTLLVAGSVGIGTANPEVDLDIYRQDEAYLRVSGTGINAQPENFSGIELGSDLPAGGAIDRIWQIAHKRGGAGGLNDLQVSYFDGAAWNPRITVQPGGNVGIWTPDPALASLSFGPSYSNGRNQFDSSSTGVGIRNDVLDIWSNPVGNQKMGFGVHSGALEIYGTTGNAIMLGERSMSAAGLFTPRMTVHANGNVGIGTITPTDAGSGYTTLSIAGPAGATGSFIDFYTGATRWGILFSQNSQTTLAALQGNPLVFDTWPGNNWDPTYERMRISPGGNVGIGTTAPGARLTIRGSTGGNNLGGLRIENTLNRRRDLYMTGNNNDVLGFFSHTGNFASLSAAGNWEGNSDRAYKKDIAVLRYGLNELLQLKPRQYRMKADNTPQVGFVGQEVREVIPEVVSGEEGQITLSYGQMVPVVVKAVQELKAENDDLRTRNDRLEARVKALEGK